MNDFKKLSLEEYSSLFEDYIEDGEPSFEWDEAFATTREKPNITKPRTERSESYIEVYDIARMDRKNKYLPGKVICSSKDTSFKEYIRLLLKTIVMFVPEWLNGYKLELFKSYEPIFDDDTDLPF